MAEKENPETKEGKNEEKKPTPVPELAVSVVKDKLLAMKIAKSSYQQYVTGVATGMGVHQDWVFNENKMEFQPPPDIKKEVDKK